MTVHRRSSSDVALPCDPGILIQVAQRAQPERVPPTLPAMLRGIVDHVAPLTERLEIGGCAVAWIVIEMRAGQDDVSHPYAGEREAALHGNPLAMSRTPASRLRIPPSAVTEMRNTLKVRPAALLAASTGALEPDRA